MCGGRTCIRSRELIKRRSPPPRSSEEEATTRRRTHGHSFCAHELHPLCPTSPRGETPKATLGPLVALSSSSSRVSSIVPVKAGKDSESPAVKPQTSLRRFSILPNSLSPSCPVLSVQWVWASRIQSLNVILIITKIKPPAFKKNWPSTESSSVVIIVLLLLLLPMWHNSSPSLLASPL